MHAALRLLNERLNATLDDDEVPDGPGWGGSAIQPAGLGEVSADDDSTTPYDARDGFNGPWTPEDNQKMSEFNTRITEDYQVQLGELIKFDNQILQVCRVKGVTEAMKELIVFDCRRFEPYSIIIRIAPAVQRMYSSQPPTIRNYLPFGRGEAMESTAGSRYYRPRHP